MGCCGESRDKQLADDGNRITPFNDGQTITQQPSAQSMPQWQEKAISFQSPSITTPVPAAQPGSQQMAQNASQQPWGQPVTSFNPYVPNGSPPLANATSPTAFTGSLNGYPVTTPSPPPNAYSPGQLGIAYTANKMTVTGRGSSNRPLSRQDFAAPSDEGKISVSIDFGTINASRPIIITYLNSSSRYNVFRCGKWLSISVGLPFYDSRFHCCLRHLSWANSHCSGVISLTPRS